MPRAEITIELSDFLRNVRIQNKIPATELANKINKSPAYISRVENGTIKTIDTEDLYTILKTLIHENSDGKIIEDIYRTLRIKYKTEEIERQLWFKNFDTVKCLIPVPDQLIDDFNNRISKLGIDRRYLLYRINSNEALPDKDIVDNTIPTNQWYISDNNNQNFKSIKLYISAHKFDAILDRIEKSAPYVYILAISFYLLKIEKYTDKIKITDEETQELMNIVTDYLNSNKFYSVLEKENLLSGNKTQEEFRQILNSFDIENYEIICDILSGIKYASDRNITYANEKLKDFSENMHWDLGFMLKIVSLDYCNLNKLSVSEKINLITDINNLIGKYTEKSVDSKQIEYY